MAQPLPTLAERVTYVVGDGVYYDLSEAVIEHKRLYLEQQIRDSHNLAPTTSLDISFVLDWLLGNPTEATRIILMSDEEYLSNFGASNVNENPGN